MGQLAEWLGAILWLLYTLVRDQHCPPSQTMKRMKDILWKFRNKVLRNVIKFVFGWFLTED